MVYYAKPEINISEEEKTKRLKHRWTFQAQGSKYQSKIELSKLKDELTADLLQEILEERPQPFVHLIRSVTRTEPGTKETVLLNFGEGRVTMVMLKGGNFRRLTGLRSISVQAFMVESGTEHSRNLVRNYPHRYNKVASKTIFCNRLVKHEPVDVIVELREKADSKYRNPRWTTAATEATDYKRVIKVFQSKEDPNQIDRVERAREYEKRLKEGDQPMEAKRGPVSPNDPETESDDSDDDVPMLQRARPSPKEARNPVSSSRKHKKKLDEQIAESHGQEAEQVEIPQASTAESKEGTGEGGAKRLEQGENPPSSAAVSSSRSGDGSANLSAGAAKESSDESAQATHSSGKKRRRKKKKRKSTSSTDQGDVNDASVRALKVAAHITRGLRNSATAGHTKTHASAASKSGGSEEAAIERKSTHIFPKGPVAGLGNSSGTSRKRKRKGKRERRAARIAAAMAQQGVVNTNGDAAKASTSGHMMAPPPAMDSASLKVDLKPDGPLVNPKPPAAQVPCAKGTSGTAVAAAVRHVVHEKAVDEPTTKKQKLAKNHNEGSSEISLSDEEEERKKKNQEKKKRKKEKKKTRLEEANEQSTKKAMKQEDEEAEKLAKEEAEKLAKKEKKRRRRAEKEVKREKKRRRLETSAAGA